MVRLYTGRCLFFGLIVIETLADQQQWNYQKEKYRRIKAGEKLDSIYAKRFVHTGLWKYMRHPNYMAEQSVWIIIYLFSFRPLKKTGGTLEQIT